MYIDEILSILKSFKWEMFQRIYGSAHSSTIGFISQEWLKQSTENSVWDGAPSPFIGKGRKDQKNADMLLCKNNRPLIVVEVENTVEHYDQKLDSLFQYFQNENDFKGLKWGLLVMRGRTKRKDNLENLKEQVRKQKYPIAFVMFYFDKITQFSDSSLKSILERNDYYPYQLKNVDCWISKGGKDESQDTLWTS